jgi:hypothetical protein
MSSEQNKAIVRRLFEEPWKGKLEVVDELTASDYIGHDPANPEPLHGPEGVKEFISTYRAAFPDARSSSSPKATWSRPAGAGAAPMRGS